MRGTIAVDLGNPELDKQLKNFSRNCTRSTRRIEKTQLAGHEWKWLRLRRESEGRHRAQKSSATYPGFQLVVDNEGGIRTFERAMNHRARNTSPGDLLVVEEVAEISQHSPRTVRDWIRAGLLPAKRVGRRHLVRRDDLEAFLAIGSQ